MSPANAIYRRWKNRLALTLMALMVLACLVPLASLLTTLLVRGVGALDWDFFIRTPTPVGESGGGLGHAIAGSMLLLLFASLVSVPLGLALGLSLSQRHPTRLAGWARLLLDVMAGIPAIVVGVFIYTIVVRPVTGFSALAGALALAMIMLPIFARTTEEALRAIPNSVREAGLALGLRRRKVILWIILRSALPAVLTGLFLSLARVGGEAAPLLLTSLGSDRWPTSLMEPVGALPDRLYRYASSPYEEWHRLAWGAAIVLVSGILAVRLLTHLYTRWRYGPGGYR